MSENVTRREFLRRGGVLVLASGKIYWDIHKSISDAVWAGIKIPQINNGIFEIADNILENQGEQNPAYRPIVEIIQEGIKSYEVNSGKCKAEPITR